MSYQINELIATKEAQLAAANEAYERSLTGSDIQSYLLDTGEGKASTLLRKPEDIRKEIVFLENQLDRLYRRAGLTRGGIVNMNLRRR